MPPVHALPLRLSRLHALILSLASLFTVSAAPLPLNVLLITADDLNCDSLGVYGCKVPETTPRLDRFAAEAMRFERAHVNIAVCQPLRSVIMTGKYSHRSGGEGFHKLRHPGQTILPQVLREAGFEVGILGKVGHSTPYKDFAWDMALDQFDLGAGRNAKLYQREARRFFTRAKRRGKPFFLMANSHDPHRPFANSTQERGLRKKKLTLARPSRPFWPSEVTVPGFLPDIPEVRLEMAEYYSSVRRTDDIVGGLLDALDASGQAGHTLVLFLSDHGMALPFAKTNCYRHSTRTPLMVRWPGQITGGSVDGDHFVSSIDLIPTILEALAIEPPPGIDGRSFLPVLRGESQERRDRVFTQFHQTSGKKRYPMRSVITAAGGYIFNAWADGETRFRNESQSGRTFKAMERAAKDDQAIAQRVKLFLHRTPEELFDYARDPDAMTNLANEASSRETLTKMREILRQWMIETEDPLLEDYEAYLRKQS